MKPDKHESLYNWSAELLWFYHLHSDDPNAGSSHLREARHVLEQRAAIDGLDVPYAYNYACVLSLEGARDEAFGQLRGHLEAGRITASWVRGDPDWARWAADAEFEALLARFS